MFQFRFNVPSQVVLQYILMQENTKKHMNGGMANGGADGPTQTKEQKSVGNISTSVYFSYFRNTACMLFMLNAQFYFYDYCN